MDDRRIAWTALRKGTPVLSKDGEDLGTVGDVIADEQKDIFSGITISGGLLSRDVFVPAAEIQDLSDAEVRLAITADDAERLEPYRP